MVLDVTNGMVVPYFYSNSINFGSNNQPILDQGIISPDAITEEEQANQQNSDRVPWYSIFSLSWNIFTEFIDAVMSIFSFV